VDTPVFFQQRWQLELHKLAYRILPCFHWQVWIEQRHGFLEAFFQNHFIVTVALGLMSIGADVFLLLDAVTELAQLFQQGLFYGGFG